MNTEIDERYHQITDICLENGGVTKPMVDKLYAFMQAQDIASRLDELKNLMAKASRTYEQKITDSNGDVYLNDSHGYISKYETQERIAELSKQLKERK